MKKLLILLLTFCYSLGIHAQLDTYSSLDQMIRTGMQDWEVPGMTVVVVKDGQVVFDEVYGVKDLESNEPVDRETLFAMCSTTKALIAIAMGMLVDDGQLQWTDKVVDVIPSFRLSDAYITADARVQDLLTHSLGYANADVLWFADSLSTEETLRRFAHGDKVYPLRSGFIYQNIMYVYAGEVIKAVSGQHWTDFVKERILDPLEMHRTQTKASGIHDVGNYTNAYYNDHKEGIIEVPRNYSDQIGAAGMMWTCSDDIKNYLLFLENGGVYKNDTLLHPATFEYLFQPHTLVTPSQFYPTQAITQPKWMSYGLGWFQHDYRGDKLDYHTGSLSGLIAMAAIVHDQDVAVYIIGNMDHAELRHAIVYKVMDLYAHNDDSRNWHREIYDLYDQMSAAAIDQEKSIAELRHANTSPSLALSDYTGEYHNDLTGTVTITLKNGQLEVSINETFKMALSHWHHDTFRSEKHPQWRFRIMPNFQLDANGNVKTVEVLGLTFDKKK